MFLNDGLKRFVFIVVFIESYIVHVLYGSALITINVFFVTATSGPSQSNGILWKPTRICWLCLTETAKVVLSTSEVCNHHQSHNIQNIQKYVLNTLLLNQLITYVTGHLFSHHHSDIMKDNRRKVRMKLYCIILALILFNLKSQFS